MICAILLALATVTDTFFAALSYSSNKIRIPFVSAFILSFISSVMLTTTVIVAHMAGEFIPQRLCDILSFVILVIVGGVQLFQKGLRSLLKKHSGSGRLSFKFLNIGFVISVYADETKADIDCSKTLSPRESLALAAALSVDSVSVGLGAGLSDVNILLTAIMSLSCGLAAVYLGKGLGKRISRFTVDLSWLSGAFLIILGIAKLF